MKNLLMFLMAISLLTACNNNPLVSKEKKTNTSEKDDKKEKKDKNDADDEYGDKDDKNVDEDDDDGVEDDYTTKDDDDETTGSGWTRAQRERYVNECITEAKKNISLTVATSYCDCMQYKIEKKYKMSFDEANRITIEDLSTPEAKADIQQCLGKN